MAPLDGITVVALEHAIAAPLASRHLADLGARVIKVERPGSGDFARHYDTTVRGQSSHFVWVNRSKESLTLNLQHTDGQAMLARLLERADVLIQNLAPGALARLGFAPDTLRARYPRLVACHISGYGDRGPYRDKKAYDLLVQAETGLLSITGSEATPSKAGIPVADIAAGMYAFSHILAALLRRAQDGAGAELQVSLFDALAEWMGYPAYFTAYGGAPPQRCGARHAAIAPYGPYTMADGETILVGIQNAREWQRFCDDVIERPELAADPRFADNPARVTHRAELDAVLAACFGALPGARALARLEAAGIANARLNSMQAFWDHPQLAARDRWGEVATPAGPIRALTPPVDMRGVAPRLDPVPDLGEHTDRILQEFGYAASDIARLRTNGTI